MKKLLYIFAISCMLLTVSTSCDKRDCNGNLDGMWQLLELRDKDNVVLFNKDSMIFYSFQLDMASFNKQSGSQLFMRSSFEYTPQQIRIYAPLDYVGNKHDSIFPMSELAPVGVPADGIFHIESLSGSRMMLKTNQGAALSFRKY